MLRLGSILLTSVLLGVPRALGARAFGAQRSVYVEVAPGDPEMQEFAEELGRALAAASFRVTGSPRDATLVVEVHRLAGTGPPSAGARRALLATVGEGPSRRRLVLDHRPEQGSRAARALLDALPAPAGIAH